MQKANQHVIIDQHAAIARANHQDSNPSRLEVIATAAALAHSAIDQATTDARLKEIFQGFDNSVRHGELQTQLTGIKAATLAAADIEALSPLQLKVMSIPDLMAFTPAQAEVLTPDQTKSLTAEQLAALHYPTQQEEMSNG